MAIERVTFTSDSATRIAKVVRIVEAGNRDTRALPVSPRLGGGGVGLKLCTFTGAWDIATSKVLTIKGQTATPNTVAATNLYLSLEPDSACDVLIGKAGTAWYLVQANMTKQPNYNAAAATQVFSIASGTMEWANVAECSTAVASPRSLSYFFP